ncbi:ABC transporter substrate-binding protein [Clostridium minihomine]|uniref:ABC transporter substrate-binding protein n=1 Tax=Clostridium minihomine TaxID=2045012 RepID=UPI000C758BC1|nr:ABC transporter substrate-binding protein [Clostridium minihomine]
MKKLITLGFSIVLLVTLISGCSPKKEEVTNIRLNEVTHSVFYAPLYAALELGLFAEEGLNVELVNGGGADKVMTAVLAGQADIGLAGPEACLYVMNEGRENYAVIFSQLTKRDGSFLVGRTDEDFAWENLKGKTIIGGRKGGVPEMTLEYVMRQNGVIPHQDAIVDTSVQFNMMAGAFTGGSSDYVTLFEPTATEIELEGKGYVLTSIGQESGEIPYTAFFASQSYIKNNPAVVQSFTNAVAKGQKWVQEHTAREIAEALMNQFPGTEIDVLTLVAQRYKDIDAWNETPIMKQESLERLETVMETAGELDQRVDFHQLVDNSFAEKAIK